LSGDPCIIILNKQHAPAIALHVVSVAIEAGGHEDEIGFEVGQARKEARGDNVPKFLRLGAVLERHRHHVVHVCHRALDALAVVRIEACMLQMNRGKENLRTVLALTNMLAIACTATQGRACGLSAGTG
jgi:hypothetical protein